VVKTTHFKETIMAFTPINESPRLGAKAPDYDPTDVDDSPSSRANKPGEFKDGHNPDFFPSSASSKDDGNQIGKGANPSADVVTKNHTTIDPVHGETPETNDDVTTVDSVPAVLPEGAYVADADGTQRKANEPSVVNPDEAKPKDEPAFKTAKPVPKTAKPAETPVHKDDTFKTKKV
jgi:hypothetical protein